jgi:hypothetical protein
MWLRKRINSMPCENGNKLPGSIKVEEFTEYLRRYLVVEKDSAP